MPFAYRAYCRLILPYAAAERHAVAPHAIAADQSRPKLHIRFAAPEAVGGNGRGGLSRCCDPRGGQGELTIWQLEATRAAAHSKINRVEVAPARAFLERRSYLAASTCNGGRWNNGRNRVTVTVGRRFAVGRNGSLCCKRRRLAGPGVWIAPVTMTF